MPDRVLLKNCLLFLGAFLLFAPSIYIGGFVLDDVIHIQNNPLLVDPLGWIVIISEPVFPGNLYRPFTFLTYWVETQILGTESYHYHFFNVLLHALNSVLLYRLLLFIKKPHLALPAAFLFALHPVHTEAVVSIVGRAEMLALFWGLLGILFVRGKLLILSTICFLLSACSKESGLLFPILAGVLLYSENANYLKKIIVPAFFTIVSFLVTRFRVVGAIGTGTGVSFIDNPLAHLETTERVYNAILLLGKYLLLSFVPFPLSADYSFAHIVPETFNYTLVGIGIPLALSVFLIIGLMAWLERSPFGVGVLWFFISFLITSNLFFPIGTVFADRLLYTPSVGVVIIIAHYLQGLNYSPLKVILGYIFLLAFTLVTFWYQQVWGNRYELYDWQEWVSPESVKTMVNVGANYRNRGFLDSARWHAEKAYRRFPESAEALYLLATISEKEGNPIETRAYLEKTLEKNPNYIPALITLGRMKLNERDFDGAHSHISKALQFEPRNTRALITLYALSIMKGNVERAKYIEVLLERYRTTDPEYLSLKNRLDNALAVENASEKVKEVEQEKVQVQD